MPDQKKMVLVNMSLDTQPIMGESGIVHHHIDDIIRELIWAIYEQDHNLESAQVFELKPIDLLTVKQNIVALYKREGFKKEFESDPATDPGGVFSAQRTDDYIQQLEQELNSEATKFLYAFKLTEDSHWSDTAQMTVSHQLVEAHNYKEAEEKMWTWVNNLYDNYKDQWEELENGFRIGDEEALLKLDLTKPIPITKEEWCEQQFKEALLEENFDESKRT